VRVYALWYGGPSYDCPSVEDDLEEFDSLASAKRALQARDDSDPYYPCVSESELQVFFTDPRGLSDPYPDRVYTLGPRGGVRCDHA